MAINSIAIKQIIGAWAFDSEETVKWMVSNVENLQITQDGETTEKRDANGSVIFTINRNKSCRVSFDSSILDLSLVAAFNGAEKEDASNDAPIRVPYIERFTLRAADITAGYVTLSKIPVAETDETYKISFHTLTTDGSLDENYSQVSSAATTTKFYYDSTNHRVYFPTDSTVFKAGTKIEIIYEYSVTSGIRVVNAADRFPDSSKVRFLVLAVDLCDQTKVRALWITAKNAKPETGNTIGFNLDDTISVTLDLAYSYCDEDKSFYEITVADEDFNWAN